jgi:hypothetical protein
MEVGDTVVLQMDLSQKGAPAQVSRSQVIDPVVGELQHL